MTRLFACIATIVGLIAPLAAPVSAQTVVPRNQTEIALGFAPLVREATPAVANIYAKVVRASDANGVADDPFFKDFSTASAFSVRRSRTRSGRG